VEQWENEKWKETIFPQKNNLKQDSDGNEEYE
jgi:hypothetical protein